MDNQQKIEDKVKLQQSLDQKNKSSWVRPIRLGLGVIGIGLLIGIGGYILGLKGTKNIIQDATQKKLAVVSPIPTLDQTANPDSIGANWKTYLNSANGFSFRYPSNWIYQDYSKGNSNEIEIRFGKVLTEDHIGQTVPPYPAGDFVLSYQKDNLSKIPEDFVKDYSSVSKTKLVEVSGIQATQIFYSGSASGDSMTIILKKDDLVYKFSIPESVSSRLSIFDQILSTFKFTDSEAIVSSSPTPTPLSAYHITQGSSLNTYTNNVYSFSFNFPKSLFLYNSQSNSEYAGFLQKQGNINALRMYVDVFKNLNDLSLEEVEAKYNLKKNQGNEYALENTTINGKDAIIVAGNKSMRELCNYNDDQKRRVVVAALVKGSKYVLVFNTNNTCETFQEDWVSDIVNSVKL